MPSPIAHVTMGLVIYRLFNRAPQPHGPQARSPSLVPRLLLATAALSLLPDLDAAVGAVVGDLGRFHNNVAHSPLFGLAASLGVGGLVWLRGKAGFFRWSLITLLCYELHVLMDYFTVGRGVMILWPISPARYSAPVAVFRGLHWSEGWLSPQHLWTLLNELAWAAVVVGIVYLVTSRKRRRVDST